jgi:type II secretory pathway component GspD/PulD (secretin)
MRRPRRWLSALLVLGACVGLGLTTEAPASAGEQPGASPARQAKQKRPAQEGAAQPGAKEARLAGPPFLKMYSVPSGQSEPLAKLLQQIYQGAANVKIVAVNSSTLAIWADPETQMAIARVLVEAIPPLRAVTEVVPLTTLKAAHVRDLLSGRRGEPFIDIDEARNALIVRGTREQIEEIREALRALGERGKTTAQPRVITLDKGSAALLAQALKEQLEKMRANPVRVVLPGQKETPPPKPAKDRPKLPGKSDAPITITPFGSKLVITSNDPEALALAEELVRLLTDARPGDDFEVIPLRHANAIAVARTLDEAFNGPPGSGMPKQPFGQGKQPLAPARPRADRVRIVADPTTNSLLVKASPLDTLTIRRLLEKTLDTPGAEDPVAVLRPFVIGPLKHTKAADVTKILQTLYRDAASTGKLAIAIDERTNSLVLRTSPALYEDVRTAVRLLEDLPEQKK